MIYAVRQEVDFKLRVNGLRFHLVSPSKVERSGTIYVVLLLLSCERDKYTNTTSPIC